MIIKLSKAGISDAIARVDALKADIIDASGKIVDDLTEYGAAQASRYNTISPQSGSEKSIVMSKVTANHTKGYVVLYGKNAIYDEFGTGEQGANDGHPRKASLRVPLKPYNSGPTIKINSKTGHHFWFVPKDVGINGTQYVGKSGYTEGIPSGKQMYNTAKDIRNKKDEIIKKRLSYAIKRANSKNK